MTKFWIRLFSIISIAAGAYIALVVFMAQFTLLEELADYDFAPEVRRLYAAGRYSEAAETARDMKKLNWGHQDDDFKRLMENAEKKDRSVTENGYRFIRGFVSGSGDTFSDAAGAVLADLVVYGDVRDLLVQSGLWLGGKETDPLLAALSGAGIVLEAVPIASWVPAALKLMRKWGAITEEFAEHLIKSLKFMKLEKGPGKSEYRLFTDLYTLFRRMGLRRSAAVMRCIKSPEDLSAAVRLAQRDPAKLHLAAISTGGEVLRMPAKYNLSRVLAVSRKGAAGLLTLKRQPLLTAVKLVSSGRLGAFLRHGARNSKRFRNGSYFLAAVLVISGSAGLVLTSKRRKKQENPEKAEK